MSKFNFITNTPSSLNEVVEYEKLNNGSTVFKIKDYVADKTIHQLSLKILNQMFSTTPFLFEVDYKNFLNAISILTIEQKVDLFDQIILAIYSEMGELAFQLSDLKTKLSDSEKALKGIDKRIKDFERRDSNNLSDYQALHQKVDRLIMTMADHKIETPDTQEFMQEQDDKANKNMMMINQIREELNKVIWILNKGFNLEDAYLRASIKEA